MTDAHPGKAAHHERLELFQISWPILVELLLMTLIGTISLWMAGHVSTAAVAIFGLAGQLRLLFDRLFRVIAIGGSVVVTQHRGGGDAAGASEHARAAFAASVWFGLVAMLVIGAAPAALLRLLQLPPELMAQAVPFILLLAVDMVFESATITMFSVLRAYTFTRDSMRLVLAMNIMQVILSLPLVFGIGTFEGLGLMGLGWGLLISRLIVFTLLYLKWRNRLGIRLLPRDIFAVPRRALGAILHIGLPSAGEKIIFRLCFLATVSMAASMGAVALATHTYAMQVAALVSIAMSGLGAGTQIIVGHHVGAGQLRAAHAVLMRALRWTLAATFVTALLSWWLAPQAVALLLAPAEVVSLLWMILAVEALSAMGRSVTVITLDGLRASGDVQFPVKASVTVNIVMGVGLAWLLGVHFQMGLVGLWIGYTADEWVRGAIMLWRWQTQGWVRYAHASRRRVLRRRWEESSNEA